MQCPDCPMLGSSAYMPAGWAPRAKCCIQAGREREQAEQRAEAARAQVANYKPNRAARRRAAKLKRSPL